MILEYTNIHTDDRGILAKIIELGIDYEILEEREDGTFVVRIPSDCIEFKEPSERDI